MDRLPGLIAVACERESPTVSARRPARVLIVDDEPYIVELLAALLEEEGFVVLRAYDGEQAWRLAERRRPDLVISDVRMPRMDGLELVGRLRGAAGLRDTRVILMSAIGGVDATGVTFLAKPFDLDRLLALVETELAG